MATLLFEGFDLHTAPYWDNTVTGGIHDYNGFPNWTHGSPAQIYIIDGKDQGKAAVVAKNFFTRTSSAGSSPIYRVSWYGKIHTTVGTPSDTELCSVGVSDSERVGLKYIAGSLYLYKFTSPLDYYGTAIGSAGAAYTTAWAHYELYVNATTNTISWWRNGNLQETVTGQLASASNLTQFRIRGIGSSNAHMHHTAWDHIVITDSETTLRDTTGYHGVAVTYHEQSKDTGSALSVRGRLYINGVDYFATAHSPFLRGNNERYCPRASNVHYDYWMVNPETGLDWGTTLDVDGWGICRVDDTGGWAIFPSAALTFVEMVGGYPQVKWTAPGTPFILDGPWVRTNDAVGWNAHVDNYPRTDPAYDYSLAGIYSGVGTTDEGPNPFDEVTWEGHAFDDLFYEDYIGVTGPGCLVFLYNTEEEIPDLGTVGFTFAEEYRTDYQDWVTVDGTGDDFCSYFISGYKIHGEGNKKFQGNYLTVNYETHASGHALVQGIWDYALGNQANEADSRSDTGRWGTHQEIYGPRNDTAFKHAFSKLKIRGHGKALQLKVKCVSGSPFFINGWTMFVTGNTVT